MRKTVFEATHADAVALFERVPFVHLAGTTPDGLPVLRTLHPVVVDERLVFHAATIGEKRALVGRSVVVTAEEVVANVPSHAVDPVRACPATTYYRAAEVRGTLEDVDDLEFKARAMQALMRRFQPEGGHAPIESSSPLYRTALGGISIMAVSLEAAVAKHKLGQNRRPEQLTQIVELLWRRGNPGDVEAVETLRAQIPTPSFLLAPDGITLCCAPTDADAEAVAALLEGTYWNVGVSAERCARAQRGAAAWIVARAARRVVGSIRVVSDSARFAYVGDVIVHPEFRGRGVATALVRTALDHPRVRDVDTVTLRTLDAMPLYARHGFEPEHERPSISRMVRQRDATASSVPSSSR